MSAPSKVIGIDPGLDGAVALLENQSESANEKRLRVGREHLAHIKSLL